MACVELARVEDRGEFFKGFDAFDGGEFRDVLILGLLICPQFRLRINLPAFLEAFVGLVFRSRSNAFILFASSCQGIW